MVVMAVAMVVIVLTVAMVVIAMAVVVAVIGCGLFTHHAVGFK